VGFASLLAPAGKIPIDIVGTLVGRRLSATD